jgi:hypothetical protein
MRTKTRLAVMLGSLIALAFTLTAGGGGLNALSPR